MSRRPLPPEAVEEDGYRALVWAILCRAMDDAAGHCDPAGAGPWAKLQAEARAWLQDEDAVEILLELGGYEADMVLARLRQGLPS
jgi:hypothetical protein